ncbi:xanthine dehydrogenase accessory protein XdhC [Halothiobacillus neapolitanus]|uniref:Xanthine dehydrogenase accessory protein XdhC n=1 Tax=Halothiobacillus neapolitanus (strain ATCC 23641 / DSM 15147 / CIP 104769 / NCIMB 8539 / c2) TaxID=555778 RepID=D0KZ30_HALNC|nr:xanthine dehydrogenase accessory protein XdhC [Halothiobacillus neapolitanus]ACX95703.1 xanthine dehydrogenase accessory protein XdhC [Halothiobacillus neapolitanus c2]TDN66009.1 xanthine dehydrogenase accessory factor [Halothiobacillus neapolitanus]
MLDWTALARLNNQPEDFVLVSVGVVKGSSPREKGTHMAVFPQRTQGTIGGGHLEFFAIQHARELLNQPPSKTPFHELSLHSTPLTPRFDQCCGGMVQLIFERIRPKQFAWLDQLATFLDTDRETAGISAERPSAWLLSDLTARTRTVLLAAPTDDQRQRETDRMALIEPIAPRALNIVIFGAGHVGQALIQSMQHLDADLTLIDSRAKQLGFATTANVQKICTTEWQAYVNRGTDRTTFLVLTHSHQLDFDIVEAILRSGRFGYCGLIGSKTKKIRFDRQFKNRGLTPPQISRLTCPIGLPEIQGKSPAVIAASVCAQILIQHSAAAENHIPPYLRTINHV